MATKYGFDGTKNTVGGNGNAFGSSAKARSMEFQRMQMQETRIEAEKTLQKKVADRTLVEQNIEK